MKDILISGGCGFIGSHLLEELIKNRNYNITIVDDLSTGKYSNISFCLDSKNLINFYFHKIQDCKINKQFDIIYHLAAKANTREKGLKDFEDNVIATEAITKLLKPNGRIIFSSSCAVYGDQAIVTEESPFQPISPYGYSKVVNELTIKRDCKYYNIYRFSNVFGERQDGSNEKGLIGVIEYCLKNNKTIEVFNKGRNYRDYIYVKDVVRALLLPIQRDILQVGRNKLYNTLELVELAGLNYKYGQNNKEVDIIKLNNSKLIRLGWNHTIEVVDYINNLKNEI